MAALRGQRTDGWASSIRMRNSTLTELPRGFGLKCTEKERSWRMGSHKGGSVQHADQGCRVKGQASSSAEGLRVTTTRQQIGSHGNPLHCCSNGGPSRARGFPVGSSYDLDNHDGGHRNVSPRDAAAAARHSRAILAGTPQTSAPHPANLAANLGQDSRPAGPRSDSFSSKTLGSNPGCRTRRERPQTELQRGISYLQSASVGSQTSRLRRAHVSVQQTWTKCSAPNGDRRDLKNGDAVTQSKNHHLRRTRLTHRESACGSTKNPHHHTPSDTSRSTFPSYSLSRSLPCDFHFLYHLSSALAPLSSLGPGGYAGIRVGDAESPGLPPRTATTDGSTK